MALLTQARENRINALRKMAARQAGDVAGAARRPEGRAFYRTQRVL